MRKFYFVEILPILREKPESPIEPVRKVVSSSKLYDFISSVIDSDHYVIVSSSDVVE